MKNTKKSILVAALFVCAVAALILPPSLQKASAQSDQRNERFTSFDGLQVTNRYSPGSATNSFTAISNNMLVVKHRTNGFSVVNGVVLTTIQNTNWTTTNCVLLVATNLALTFRNGLLVNVAAP